MHIVLAVFMLLLMLSGCAMARGQHQMFDTATMMPPVKLAHAKDVALYRNGAIPETGCFKVAQVAAHGNAYATPETLESKLQDEAEDIGAEFIIVLGSQVSNGMAVGTYGGGIALGSTIQYPSLYGIACRTPRVVMGARTGGKDKDFIVQYVTKGSPAEQAGLLEGDKLLTINGRFVADDPFLWEKEIYSKSQGDRATVEYLRNGKKESAVITLMGTTGGKPTSLASPYYSK